jgi:D-alanyl-D-alanine carboxypeptidase
VDTTVISPSFAGAAGGIVSTARDLARFYSALLAGRLLPAPLLREMMTTVPAGQGAGYGLGILSAPFPCATVWGHQGSIPGYSTFAFATADTVHRLSS